MPQRRFEHAKGDESDLPWRTGNVSTFTAMDTSASTGSVDIRRGQVES